MTEQRDDGTNIYRWTPALFEEKKAEAKQMTLERLAPFIEDCMRRCERDDQTVGSMVLAGIAATTAALRCRKQQPSMQHIAMGALLLYAEMMGIQGPFRIVAYDYMLRLGTKDHFDTVIDWEAAQWLRQEAQARLSIPGLDAGMKAWLNQIARGNFPYGWKAQKIPLDDGFQKRG